VARMIMTGEEFIGKEPFREVLVHATVMTEDGKRMSKSLGTGVDPLELIRLYGADATRFGLTSLVTETQDIRFKMLWESGGKAARGPEDRLARAEQIEQMRNFCNKLWNISRFVLMNMGDEPPALRDLDQRGLEELKGFETHRKDACLLVGELKDAGLELADHWILSRFAAASASVNDALDRYDLGEASWTLYHFLWDEFADWYLELAKPRLRSEDPQVVRSVLLHVLEAALRLAHPFLPFVTEEIWQSLPGIPEGSVLMLQRYPGAHADLRDPEAEASMEAVMEVTRVLRNLKSELGVPQQVVDAYVADDSRLNLPYVEQSARVRITHERPTGPAANAVGAGIEVAIATAGLVDPAAEKAKNEKELAAARKELQGVEGRLNNEQFLSRAPAEIVEKVKAQQAELMDRIAKLEVRLR
jgi:valyl-tRNA synthetase